ncbi:unnamed protein product [Rhizophagus irregularis]|nr:unnamed protein product [Rhizophagus irregularis]
MSSEHSRKANTTVATGHTQQILSLSHVLLLKPKQHCPLMLEVLLIRIVKYPKKFKINIKKALLERVGCYIPTYRSNKQAEESKARKQAKQPDAIINEIDQLTDSEANCPECKNCTHAYRVYGS